MAQSFKQDSTAHNGQRLQFLDGLRGWGAIIVVLYHVFVEIYPVTPDSGQFLFHLFPFNGGLAIFVFFIVSGYALSLGYLRSGNKRTLERILVGRYFRLMVPIMLGSLIVFACARLGLLLEPLRQESAFDFEAVLRFALYGTFDLNTVAVGAPIPQLWTMPYEAIGSVMIIGLLWVIGASHFRYPVYFILLWCLLFKPMYAAFVVGALLAEANQLKMSDRTSNRISLAATILLIPSLLSVAVLPGSTELTLLCISSAVALCVAFSKPIVAFLSNPISSFLGSISFPLYILHGVIIFSIGTWLQQFANSPLKILIANIITVVAAVAFARVFRWTDAAGIIASRAVGSLIQKRPSIGVSRAD